MKIKAILVVVLTLIISGVIVCFVVFNQEKTYYINNTSYSINDINKIFMSTNFYQDKNCKSNISKNNIEVECNKKNIINIDKYQISVSIENEESNSVFKYIVASFQELIGNDKNNYYNYIDKFLNDEIISKALQKENNNLIFNMFEKIELEKKLDIYSESNIISLDNKYFIYKSNNTTIDSIKMDFISDLNAFNFSGVVSGENLDKKRLNIKFYDESKNLLSTNHIYLNKINSYGLKNKVVSVVTIFNEFNVGRVKYYSLEISF